MSANPTRTFATPPHPGTAETLVLRWAVNHLPQFLVLACALLLGGCATPLNVAKDSGRFAETLGISTNDVLFLNYCFFGKAPKGPEPKFKRIDGAVVATATQLDLVDEKLQKNGEPAHMALKFSEMQSVAHIKQGLGCQIHIQSVDDIIVLNVTKGPFWDRRGSKTLFDLIAAKGVRVIEATRWYDFIGTGGMAPIPLGF